MDNKMLFYFDFISPYAYLAWLQIEKFGKECHIEIEPVPVLFAGLLNHWGQKGPAEISAKRTFFIKDTMRRAAHIGKQIAFPPFHPFNPLLPLRLIYTWDRPWKELIQAIFHACWRDSRDITSRKVLQEIMAQLPIKDGKQRLERCNETQVKERLRQQTEEAVAAGVFGVPSMQIGEEIFWGEDQLSFIKSYLEGKDSVDREKLSEYIGRPQVVRPLK